MTTSTMASTFASTGCSMKNFEIIDFYPCGQLYSSIFAGLGVILMPGDTRQSSPTTIWSLRSSPLLMTWSVADLGAKP